MSPAPYSDADPYRALLGHRGNYQSIESISSLFYFRVISTIQYCYDFFWTQSISGWGNYGHHIWSDTRIHAMGPSVYVVPLYYKN